MRIREFRSHGDSMTSFDEKFENLRRGFIVRTREDFAALTCFQQSRQPPGPELISIVHRMAGTAGLLGYDAISAVAGCLDEALAENRADTMEKLRDLLAVLQPAISPEDKAG